MNNCIYITSNYYSDIHVNIIYLCDMMMILSENSATTEKHVLSLGLCPAGQVFSMWPECRHLTTSFSVCTCTRDRQSQPCVSWIALKAIATK